MIAAFGRITCKVIVFVVMSLIECSKLKEDQLHFLAIKMMEVEVFREVSNTLSIEELETSASFYSDTDPISHTELMSKSSMGFIRQHTPPPTDSGSSSAHSSPVSYCSAEIMQSSNAMVTAIGLNKLLFSMLLDCKSLCSNPMIILIYW